MKKIGLLTTLLLGTILLTGCASNNNENTPQQEPENKTTYTNLIPDEEDSIDYKNDNYGIGLHGLDSKFSGGIVVEDIGGYNSLISFFYPDPTITEEETGYTIGMDGYREAFYRYAIPVKYYEDFMSELKFGEESVIGMNEKYYILEFKTDKSDTNNYYKMNYIY